MRRHPVVIERSTADDGLQSASTLAQVLDLQSRCEAVSKLDLPTKRIFFLPPIRDQYENETDWENAPYILGDNHDKNQFSMDAAFLI